MLYITGFERDGMVKNARESVIEVLETLFEILPAQLSDRLEETLSQQIQTRSHPFN
jgi:hypothetical protein